MIFDVCEGQGMSEMHVKSTYYVSRYASAAGKTWQNATVPNDGN